MPRGTFGGWRSLTLAAYGPPVVEPESGLGRARGRAVRHRALVARR